MAGILAICLRNSCFFCLNPQDLQKNDTDMEMKFERICASICEGRYDPSQVSPDMDNLFYERFGMSSMDVACRLSKPCSLS